METLLKISLGFALGLIAAFIMIAMIVSDNELLFNVTPPEDDGFVVRGEVTRVFDGLIINDPDDMEYVLGATGDVVLPETLIEIGNQIDIDFQNGKYIVTCVDCDNEEPNETPDSRKGSAPVRERQ